MKLPDLEHEPERIPIPEAFQSFQHEGPFEECLICERHLLDEGVYYLVEKAYKQQEVLFEYAICMDCRTKLQKDVSKKSQQAVERHFSRQADLVQRQKRLHEEAPRDLAPWIERCVLTGKPREQAREFQLITLCNGDQMVFGYLPYMICGEAMRKISALLSKKTRERLDDFVKDHLGLPPGIRDLDLVLA